MLCIHMILDGVCATKNIWSEYVLVTFWLHFGYILVTFWLRVCIGFDVLCLQGIVICEVGSQEGDNQELYIAQCDKSKPNLP
jgi:hypothetical protein